MIKIILLMLILITYSVYAIEDRIIFDSENVSMITAINRDVTANLGLNNTYVTQGNYSICQYVNTNGSLIDIYGYHRVQFAAPGKDKSYYYNNNWSTFIDVYSVNNTLGELQFLISMNDMPATDTIGGYIQNITTGWNTIEQYPAIMTSNPELFNWSGIGRLLMTTYNNDTGHGGKTYVVCYDHYRWDFPTNNLRGFYAENTEFNLNNRSVYIGADWNIHNTTLSGNNVYVGSSVAYKTMLFNNVIFNISNYSISVANENVIYNNSIINAKTSSNYAAGGNNNITITNSKIYNYTAYGFMINGYYNVTIINNEIKNSINNNTQDLFRLKSVKNAIISNNNITNISDKVIFGYGGCNNVIVNNNYISGAGEQGVAFSNCTNITINNNTIYNISVINGYAYGLDCYDLSDNCTFTNNYINNVKIGLSLNRGSNYYAENNTIINSSSYGLLMKCINCTAKNTIIINNSDRCVTINENIINPENVKLYNVSIENCNNYGFYIGNANNISIYNITFGSNINMPFYIFNATNIYYDLPFIPTYYNGTINSGSKLTNTYGNITIKSNSGVYIYD